ncbi:MAG: hypothetical protein JW759_01270 [Candidatus Coatesbacteria bacterium]|nr:hypothetical protein [Candidatus Coatesbacteria bacterium]
MIRWLYKRRAVVVWVEDVLTKEYLRVLWQDPKIAFAVAAGRDAVSSLTTDARSGSDARKNVFGIRDRDFGDTNFPDWKPDTCIFTLPRYEIENYLLDWDALAGCAGEGLRRSAAEIERRVKKRATALTWWASCKRALLDLRMELTGSFPADPTQDEITDRASALNYVLKTNDWHGHVCGLLTTNLANYSVANNLSKYHGEIKQTINAGDWPETFPGKPLLREARSYVRGAKGALTPEEADVDLAKAVANWQVDHKQQPADLMTLRDCVIKRTGLPTRSSRHP